MRQAQRRSPVTFRVLARRAANLIAGLAILDVMILSCAMTSVAIGQETGYWAPFWLIQAKAVVKAIIWMGGLI